MGMYVGKLCIVEQPYYHSTDQLCLVFMLRKVGLGTGYENSVYDRDNGDRT